MKQKKPEVLNENEDGECENDSFLNLTIYDVPESLLRKFCEQIVKPKYSFRVSTAIKDLMRKAVLEQNSAPVHAEDFESGKNG